MDIHIHKNMINRLPSHILSVLIKISRMAASLGSDLYLVGGVVRDLLLDRPNMDIDIMVEGDAISLAEEIEAMLSVKAITHKRFGTVTVKLDGYRLDLASCRSETYIQPGALPSVKPGNISDDLFRRDFTINAMALSINPDRPGELVDLFGGLRDLKGKTVRVLHDGSFVDDATRIMRAVRYEQRLGFKLEKHTASLLKSNLDMLDTISSDRLRREVLLWMSEDRPEKIIKRSAELGILPKLHTALSWEPGLQRSFSRSHRLTPAPSQQLYFCMLTYGLSEDTLYEFLQRLNLIGTQYDRLCHQTPKLKSMHNLLGKPGLTRADLYFMLKEYSPIAIQSCLLHTHSRRIAYRLRMYLLKLRHVKPMLNGRNLSELGIKNGPETGRILRELAKARLDGKAKTIQDEIRLVKILAAELLEQGKQPYR